MRELVFRRVRLLISVSDTRVCIRIRSKVLSRHTNSRVVCLSKEIEVLGK